MLTADNRYSNIITNGDLAPEFVNVDGTPRRLSITEAGLSGIVSGDDARVVLRYYNHKVLVFHLMFTVLLRIATSLAGAENLRSWRELSQVNMAPYLFFLGVGTYDTYTRSFEYPGTTACHMTSHYCQCSTVMM